MQFSVSTKELNEAISIVTRAMPSHSSLSILEGIYFYAYNNTLFMKCSDLSLQIETEIPAMVIEEGSAVMPGRLCADLIKRFNGETVDFAGNDNSVKISSGRVKTSLQVNSADDYPEMVKVNDEFSAEISKSVLKNMIRQTAFSVSVDDTKPILNGVCLKFSDNQLVMVALDGFRLAMRKEMVEDCTGEKSVIIPTRAINEISSILPNDDEKIRLIFSSTHVKIKFGETSIISRLLDGEYVNYKGILPKSFSTKVLVSCSELRESVERASLMARESKSNLIKLSFTEGMLSITANSEKGNIDDEIEVQTMGKELEIAFNAKYVLEVMKNIDAEQAYLNMNNSVMPCVITPIEGDAFYYMVLPVRLFSGK